MKEQVLKEFNEWLKEQSKLDITWIRCGCYIRVSSDKQEEYSPISQLKNIYEYCITNKYYLDPNEIFIEDEGVSAKGSNIDKRTEFNRMISIAKSKPKPFEILILWKFSRFCRNQEQSVVYKNLLRKQCGIEIISITEPIVDGPFGELIERFIEWSDEYYLTNLSQEVTRGMTEKATKGEYQSVAPFGYRWENGNLLVKKEEADMIHSIYKMFLKEDKPIIEIARCVNNLGFRTKSNGKFENRTIVYILLNPIYKGYTRWTPGHHLTREELYKSSKSIIEKGRHEPIVDEETWNLAVEKLNKNRTFRHPHEKTISDPYDWIKGLIRCKKCGRTFIRSNKKLRCNGYNKGTCDINDAIDIEEAKSLILNVLKDTFASKIRINVSKPNTRKYSSDKDLLENRINELNKNLIRAKEAYLNGIDTIEEYKSNKAKINDNINIIERQLNQLVDVNNEIVTNVIYENSKTVYELLIDSNVPTKKKYDIVHTLINKVEYDNGTLSLYFNELTTNINN